jgi:hypothetical protein
MLKKKLQFQLFILIVLGLTFTVGQAEAKCSNVGNSRYSPITNDTVERELACDAAGGKMTFKPGTGYAFTGTSVVRRASNGSVQAFSHGFTYKPKAGFSGSDRFSMRVCGTKANQSGCSTLNYSVTVN